MIVGPIVSIAKAIPSLLELIRYQNSKTFYHVSIAKAIPSLLEPFQHPQKQLKRRSFNRESDSVTVGAIVSSVSIKPRSLFQSRKRFRHCWSTTTNGCTALAARVSIAKAIPSLLEPGHWDLQQMVDRVSIAKAIPSLLELKLVGGSMSNDCSFNRESDSVTVGAELPYMRRKRSHLVSIAKAIPSLLEHRSRWRTTRPGSVSIAKAIPSLLEHGKRFGRGFRIGVFQSRKRFRHCWSPIESQTNRRG